MNPFAQPMDCLRSFDPEMADLACAEYQRQLSTLNLIVSENYASPYALALEGSILANKNAGGYPDSRGVGGCQVVNAIENLAMERIKQLFGCDHVNLQAMSATIANLAVLQALLQPGDTILALGTELGGHMSHGAAENLSGMTYQVVTYGFDPATEQIDLAQVEALAKAHRPKLIICGSGAYPRKTPYREFGAIAKSVGAYLLADIAHPAGLVLLVCPVLLVIMMLKGKNFIYALMFNTILAALLCLVTGKLSFSLFFDAEGVVAQGLGNCMNAAVLCMLIFMVIQILKVSGVFAKISAVVVAKCRTYKQAEGIVGFLAMLGAAMMGGGTYSILLSGGLARNLLKNFQVARTRGANILDGLACGTAGLLPYGGAVLYAVSCAAATGMVGSEFTAFSFIPYNYHCMLLIAVYWISIIIGFGKKFEKDEAI